MEIRIYTDRAEVPDKARQAAMRFGRWNAVFQVFTRQARLAIWVNAGVSLIALIEQVPSLGKITLSIALALLVVVLPVHTVNILWRRMIWKTYRLVVEVQTATPWRV